MFEKKNSGALLRKEEHLEGKEVKLLSEKFLNHRNDERGKKSVTQFANGRK